MGLGLGNFGSEKNFPVLQVLIWGFEGPLRFLTGVWYLGLDFESCPVSPNFGLWRPLEVPDLVMALWFSYGYDCWSVIHQWFELWFSIQILKMQSTYMSFKSLFGALEDPGGSRLGFGIWILLLVLLQIFDIPMILILALYLDFKGANNIYVL